MGSHDGASSCVCCPVAAFLALQVLPRATSEELQQLVQGLLLLDVQVSKFGPSPAQAVNASGDSALLG
jgi:hypothetical protein